MKKGLSPSSRWRSEGHLGLTKRRAVQFVSMVLCNADIRQWGQGGISRSPVKRVCVPGLNCYSCPAAVGSCPLGAVQNAFGTGTFPLLAAGMVMAFGALLGRMVCGFLCPAGLVQELLYKIRRHKERLRENARMLYVTRKLSLFKYAVLVVLCIMLPLVMYIKEGIGAPLFCKYICPAGTLGAGVPLVIASESIRQGVGRHFVFKCVVASLFAVWSVFWYRPFCVFFCPLGAIYSLFNKTSIFGPVADSTKCTHCGKCIAVCKMPTAVYEMPAAVCKRSTAARGGEHPLDALGEAVNREEYGIVFDRECIRCGKCIASCPTKAISWRCPSLRPFGPLSDRLR